MSVKAILVLCAQALFIQSVFSQCASLGIHGAGLSGYGLGVPSASLAGSGLSCGAGLGYGAGIGLGSGLGNGIGLGLGSGVGCAGQGYGGLAIGAIPTSGGALPVSSSSAIAPTGLSLDSENVYEGALSVAGELPFLSVVALDGVFPSAGAGVVNYSCGNGVTAIESVGSSGAAYAPAVAHGSGIASIAPGAAVGSGLGYGGLAGYGGASGCGCGCGLH